MRLDSLTSNKLDKTVQNNLRRRFYNFDIAERVATEEWGRIGRREREQGKEITHRSPNIIQSLTFVTCHYFYHSDF